MTAHKTALGSSSSVVEPYRGGSFNQELPHAPPAFNESHTKRNNFAGKNPFSLHPAELVLPASEMKNPPRRRTKQEAYGSKSILSQPQQPEYYDEPNDPYLYVEEEKGLDPIAAP